jgi:succinoglycan biosynthesis protein ExoO
LRSPIKDAEPLTDSSLSLAQNLSTVSVAIPAFNAEATIERAIRSALSQTHPPLEVIVVDDASTDHTRDVVGRLIETWPNLKLLSCPKNKGPSAARNAAIDIAIGPWVGVLDADDAWEPQRLESLTRLGDQLGADFVADNLILFDQAAGRAGATGFRAPWKNKRLTVQALFESDMLEGGFSYGLLKPLMRRASLARLDLRYDEAMRYGEDFQFYAEALLRGASFWVTCDAYYVYTTRFGEFSRSPSQHSRSTPRFDLLAEANAGWLARMGPNCDARLRRTLVRRGERLMATHRANVAREYRQARQWVRYVSYVMLHLDLLRLLVVRTLKRSARWLARGAA